MHHNLNHSLLPAAILHAPDNKFTTELKKNYREIPREIPTHPQKKLDSRFNKYYYGSINIITSLKNKPQRWLITDL